MEPKIYYNLTNNWWDKMFGTIWQMINKKSSLVFLRIKFENTLKFSSKNNLNILFDEENVSNGSTQNIEKRVLSKKITTFVADCFQVIWFRNVLFIDIGLCCKFIKTQNSRLN